MHLEPQSGRMRRGESSPQSTTTMAFASWNRMSWAPPPYSALLRAVTAVASTVTTTAAVTTSAAIATPAAVAAYASITSATVSDTAVATPTIATGIGNLACRGSFSQCTVERNQQVFLRVHSADISDDRNISDTKTGRDDEVDLIEAGA